jgi:hypothetical protein
MRPQLKADSSRVGYRRPQIHQIQACPTQTPSLVRPDCQLKARQKCRAEFLHVGQQRCLIAIFDVPTPSPVVKKKKSAGADSVALNHPILFSAEAQAMRSKKHARLCLRLCCLGGRTSPARYAVCTKVCALEMVAG